MNYRSIIFSIIIPVFNQDRYVSDSLCSLISQSFSNWEAIVVNDGSTDSSEDVARNFSKQDSRISVISQPNSGLSAARNTGMGAANGEFLLFLDADDWYAINALEQLFTMISKFPEFELYLFGYSHWTSPKGPCFNTSLPRGKGFVFPEILYLNLGPCNSVLIRNSFAQCLGGFDTRLKSCEDWDFWIRAGKMGATYFSLGENLAAYRYVKESMSRHPRRMYEALSQVSQRAFSIDERLPEDALNNVDHHVDFSDIQKNHMIRCLGVLIQQGKPLEAGQWYNEESDRWNWSVSDEEWKGLSTYLSWQYFAEKAQIVELFQELVPNLILFFGFLGYYSSKTNSLIEIIMRPQQLKLNHLKYGRWLGAVFNRIGI